MTDTNIHYDKDNYREYLYSGLIGFIFRYQHHKLSPDYLINEKKILEVGPGFEPHIKFKKLNYEEYHCIELSKSIELKKYFQNEFPDIFFRNYDGKKIEHPDNIIQNKIRPNYSFYITNQIMKPVQQVFALVLENIDAFKRKKRNFQMQIETLKNTIDEPDKLATKISDLKNKEVKALLFDAYLRETDNTKNGMKSITTFFT